VIHPIKFYILLNLVSALFSSRAFAVKPCNNVELCQRGEEFDRIKCMVFSKMVIVGKVTGFHAKPPGLVNQKFNIEIEKVEKGHHADLGGSSFRTGCSRDSDLSVPLGDVKKNAGSKFRFYLSKSKKEKSGFKVIHYEAL
jgi:hypothetical protein